MRYNDHNTTKRGVKFQTAGGNSDHPSISEVVQTDRRIKVERYLRSRLKQTERRKFSISQGSSTSNDKTGVVVSRTPAKTRQRREIERRDFESTALNLPQIVVCRERGRNWDSAPASERRRLTSLGAPAVAILGFPRRPLCVRACGRRA